MTHWVTEWPFCRITFHLCFPNWALKWVSPIFFYNCRQLNHNNIRDTMLVKCILWRRVVISFCLHTKWPRRPPWSNKGKWAHFLSVPEARLQGSEGQSGCPLSLSNLWVKWFAKFSPRIHPTEHIYTSGKLQGWTVFSGDVWLLGLCLPRSSAQGNCWN